ncbi:BPSL0067 family protein [Duganella aquatilis]|uniref:BPSL0067 family protein n=1 Tax=Duganella aquatilis TaxID=2666082 RepID=UPI0012B0E2D0
MNKLQGHDPVGSGECVALVQQFAKAPQTTRWRPGLHVLDAEYIAPGTAIATFSSPIAPFRSTHGNHAALFMYAGPKAPDTKQPKYIVVMDQWKGREGGIKARRINYYSPEAAKAKRILDSDNAAAFYVIR